MTPVALVGLMVVAGSVVAPAAQEVDKRVCVAAHEAAQELRQRNQLAESREKLLLCSDPACPSVVSEECQALLAEIDQEATPDEAGASSAPAVSEKIAAPDGAEKTTAAAAVVVVPPAAAVVGVGPAPARAPHRARPSYAALLTGGLAVVALSSAAFFGWRGLSQADELRHTCSPECEPSQVSPVRRQLLIADLSLLAGVGLGTVAAWMIWSGRSGETRAAPLAAGKTRGQSAAMTGWSVVPGLSSLNVEYGGRF